MPLSLLQKRGDIYHFRWTIPHDLRLILKRRELTKSLRTSSKLAALSEAAELYSFVEKIVKIRRLYQVGKLSRESLEVQIQQIWNQVGNDLIRPPTDRPLSQAQEENANRKNNLRTLSVNPQASVNSPILAKLAQSEDAGVIRVRIAEGAVNRRYKRAIGDLLDGAGLEFDNEDLDVLVEQMLQAQAYYAQRMTDFLNVDKPIQPPVFVTPVTGSESGIAEEQAPLFSDYHSGWLSKKINDGLGEKPQKSYARFFEDWLELMPDKSIAQYTKKEIRDFILMLATAPKRNLKEYKDKSLTELLELDIPSNHRVASKTADEARKWLQGVFSLARIEDLITTSPATDLKLKFSASKPYGAFSDSEICTMLENVSSRKDWKKWIVWVAAFTGMRRKEIAQLQKKDIKFDQDSQRHFISVTDEGEGQTVKSEASRRKVPLHRQLENSGFLDFVQNCEDSLFPNLQLHSITGWFNSRFKNDLEIPAFDDSEQRLVFHSFRHSVITKALSSNEMVLVQEVVGHEKQQMGVTNRYNHKRPLSVLLPVIDCIEFQHT